MLSQTVLSMRMTPYMMTFAWKFATLSSQKSPIMVTFVAERDDA